MPKILSRDEYEMLQTDARISRQHADARLVVEQDLRNEQLRYSSLHKKYKALEDRFQKVVLEIALQGFEVVITPASPERTDTIHVPAQPERVTVSRYKRER